MDLKSNRCTVCGKILSNDDIGIYKKMINRGAEECMCIKCLADEISVSVEELNARIEYFRQIGCTLFL